MGLLKDAALRKLRVDYKVKPPLDTVALCFLFVIGSFVLPMIAKLVYVCLFKKETPRMFDESTFTYCKPDNSGGANDMTKILK